MSVCSDDFSDADWSQEINMDSMTLHRFVYYLDQLRSPTNSVKELEFYIFQEENEFQTIIGYLRQAFQSPNCKVNSLILNGLRYITLPQFKSLAQIVTASISWLYLSLHRAKNPADLYTSFIYFKELLTSTPYKVVERKRQQGRIVETKERLPTSALTRLRLISDDIDFITYKEGSWDSFEEFFVIDKGNESYFKEFFRALQSEHCQLTELVIDRIYVTEGYDILLFLEEHVKPAILNSKLTSLELGVHWVEDGVDVECGLVQNRIDMYFAMKNGVKLEVPTKKVKVSNPISCPFCYEPYGDQVKIGMLDPCRHTCCTTCWEKVTDRKCPYCRSSSTHIPLFF